MPYDESDAEDVEVEIVSEFTPGGHEHDEPDWKRLFAILVVLGILTVITSIGVLQLFNWQARAVEEETTSEVSQALIDYEAQMQQVTTGYAAIDRAAGKYRVPVDQAARLVLQDPARLKAGPPPPDFKHPDDEAAN